MESFVKYLLFRLIPLNYSYLIIIYLYYITYYITYLEKANEYN